MISIRINMFFISDWGLSMIKQVRQLRHLRHLLGKLPFDVFMFSVGTLPKNYRKCRKCRKLDSLLFRNGTN